MTETLYFGTYTKKTSEGIYKASLDTTTGLLSDRQLVAKEPNPTYLTFDKSGHLYSVGAETERAVLQLLTMTVNLLITLLTLARHFVMWQ
jgi:6-phosphogluconolactonase